MLLFIIAFVNFFALEVTKVSTKTMKRQQGFKKSCFYKNLELVTLLRIVLCFTPASWSSGDWFVSGAGRYEVQILGESNWTQFCQRLATAAAFLR